MGVTPHASAIYADRLRDCPKVRGASTDESMGVGSWSDFNAMQCPTKMPKGTERTIHAMAMSPTTILDTSPWSVTRSKTLPAALPCAEGVALRALRHEKRLAMLCDGGTVNLAMCKDRTCAGVCSFVQVVSHARRARGF